MIDTPHCRCGAPRPYESRSCDACLLSEREVVDLEAEACREAYLARIAEARAAKEHEAAERQEWFRVLVSEARQRASNQRLEIARAELSIIPGCKPRTVLYVVWILVACMLTAWCGWKLGAWTDDAQATAADWGP